MLYVVFGALLAFSATASASPPPPFSPYPPIPPFGTATTARFDLVFNTLDIIAFEDEIYNITFRTNYIESMKTALRCQKCWILIISIEAASIAVKTQVIYPIQLDGETGRQTGQEPEIPLAPGSLITMLINQPQDLFTEDFLQEYESPELVPLNQISLIVASPPPPPPPSPPPPSYAPAVVLKFQWPNDISMVENIKAAYSNQVIKNVKPEICPEYGPDEICTMVEICFASQCSQASRPVESGQTGKFEIHYKIMFQLTLPTPSVSAIIQDWVNTNKLASILNDDPYFTSLGSPSVIWFQFSEVLPPPSPPPILDSPLVPSQPSPPMQSPPTQLSPFPETTPQSPPPLSPPPTQLSPFPEITPQSPPPPSPPPTQLSPFPETTPQSPPPPSPPLPAVFSWNYTIPLSIVTGIFGAVILITGSSKATWISFALCAYSCSDIASDLFLTAEMYCNNQKGLAIAATVGLALHAVVFWLISMFYMGQDVQPSGELREEPISTMMLITEDNETLEVLIGIFWLPMKIAKAIREFIDESKDPTVAIFLLPLWIVFWTVGMALSAILSLLAVAVYAFFLALESDVVARLYAPDDFSHRLFHVLRILEDVYQTTLQIIYGFQIDFTASVWFSIGLALYFVFGLFLTLVYFGVKGESMREMERKGGLLRRWWNDRSAQVHPINPNALKDAQTTGRSAQTTLRQQDAQLRSPISMTPTEAYLLITSMEGELTPCGDVPVGNGDFEEMPGQ